MPNHILIVDDEETTVDLMRLMFKTFDHPVEGAGTGTEALGLADADPPLMIVLDLMLPDMSGFEVCAALKAQPKTAHVPVVMLTARHDDATREKASAVGANHFLTKPVTRAQLRECLEQVLKRVQ